MHALEILLKVQRCSASRGKDFAAEMEVKVGYIGNTVGSRGYLEAGCDGCKLVVCRLGVAYEIIPAGEHFPAKNEIPIVSVTCVLMSVPCHPAN